MLPVLTPKQMAECDRLTIESGTPSSVLMERAGAAVTSHAIRLMGGAYGKRVTVLVGSGNNGGDGLVIARRLQRSGALVKVALMTPASDLKGDSLAMYQRLVPQRIAVGSPSASILADACAESDLIIDSLFGTGFHGKLEGTAAQWVEAVTTSRCTVISVDIPSGLDGSSGIAAGPAIRADVTVAIEAIKTGLVSGDGPAYSGMIAVAPIGILVANLEPSAVIFEHAEICETLPRRPVTAHKWSAGSVMVVAGSRGMSGAAHLTARAALKAGAGIVMLCVPRSIQPVIASISPEIITMGLPETRDGCLDEDAIHSIVERSSRFRVLAIGPGLGGDRSTAAVVMGLLNEVEKPVVLDADGLNLLSSAAASVIGRRRAPTVITPHAGELARLLGASVSDVEAERLDVAAEVATKWDCVLLLKGPRSLIAAPDVPVAVNPTGGPELATAGSGDVLTGIVSALVAQGLSPRWGAVAAAFVHGIAGGIAARQAGGFGVSAVDILSSIPEALFSIGGSDRTYQSSHY